MKIKGLFILFLLSSLIWLAASCSGGSSSGGGSTSTNGGTVSTAYSKTDLQGTWRWVAYRQTTPLTLTGTLTFNGEVRVIGWETDRCPGRQIFSSAFFWLWDSGYVKGNNPAFCSDTSMEVKFSMNFAGSNRKTITGLMDIHYPAPATQSYDRYDITMTKQ